MGSFNAACGISGASISRDERMGMVPIIPQKYNTGLDWAFGGCDKYIPVSPPIYGLYDDYGKIYDIERSPVVDYLEKVYGMPIELFVKCSQEDDPTGWRVVKDFYAEDSVVRTDAYTELNAEIFIKLGFTKIEEALGEVWEFDGFAVTPTKGDNENGFGPSFSVSFEDWSDDRSIFAPHVSTFVEKWHKLTHRWLGLSYEDSIKFNKVSDVVFMPFVPEVFDNIVATKRVQNVYEHMFDRLLEELPEGFKEIEQSESNPPIIWVVHSAESVREVVSLVFGNFGYQNILEFPDEWRKIFQLADVMRAANRAYLPMISGEQGGNPWAEKAIGEILVKRYEKFMKEYGEDFEEDYDEEDYDEDQ